MTTKTKKLHEMDILRAFAIILIVAFHSTAYIEIAYKKVIPWDYIAIIGLGLFFFISGFLLYYNYKQINFKNQLKTFYYKRAIRIYPLYWFSLLLILLWLIYDYGFISFPPDTPNAAITFPMLLSGILGVQALTNGNIGFNNIFFWFVGVILAYYVIYPFYTKPKRLVNMISVSLIILLLFYLLSSQLRIIPGFFIFYYLFFAGIVVCSLNENYKSVEDIKNYFKGLNYINLIEYVFLFVLTFILLQTPFSSIWEYVVKLLIVTLGFYALFKLFVSYLDNNHNDFFKSKTNNLIMKISRGSYAIYLLHVTIFIITVDILARLDLSSFQTLVIILVSIPLAFVLGYYVQMYENSFVRWFNFRKMISIIQLKIRT